jgi:hypothetical protein
MRFRSEANFVGVVVSFLNVLEIRLRSLLLAAALSFECSLVLAFTNCGSNFLFMALF